MRRREDSAGLASRKFSVGKNQNMAANESMRFLLTGKFRQN
jgi:hypothetical protein